MTKLTGLQQNDYTQLQIIRAGQEQTQYRWKQNSSHGISRVTTSGLHVVRNKSSETFSNQHSPNSNPRVYEIFVLMEIGYNTNRKTTERRNEHIRYVKKGNNSSALAATLLWNRTHNKIWGHQDTNHRHTRNRTDVRQALEIARHPFYLNIRDNTWNIAIPWKHSNNQLNIFWPIVAAQVPVLSMNNQKCQKVTSQIIKRRSNQQNSHSSRR